MPSSVADYYVRGYKRCDVLLHRWAKRVGWNDRLDNPNATEEELQKVFRLLYQDFFGCLPNQQLDPQNPAPYPIAIDPATPGPFKVQQAGEKDPQGARIAENERVQTQHDRSTVEGSLKAAATQGNEEPLCVVRDFNTAYIEKQLPLAGQLMGKVRKALLTDSKTRVSRFRDSGSIDLTRMTDIVQMTDITTVYKRITKGRSLDVCVQIYIDESGSMSSKAGKGEDDDIPKMSVAAAASAAMSKVMRQLDIKHQLIVYDNDCRIIKNWRSNWEHSMLQHAAGAGGTDAPNALATCVPKMLKERRESRKVAIVITDGNLSTWDDFYDYHAKQHIPYSGLLRQFKERGVEFYAIGINTSNVLVCDPKKPTVDYWGAVGVGDRIDKHKNINDYRSGNPPFKITTGFNGGIDSVDCTNLLPKLSEHLVDVLTQGRQVVR